MTIAVTGATGNLGGLAIDALLRRGVPAGEVVAVVRDVSRGADLAARGVGVRLGDYDRPETLSGAMAGVDRLLLVSGTETGRRVAQHQAVVDAAVTAGVALVAYTSIPRSDTTKLLLAADHLATEELIDASGIPFVFLRNSWYLEKYTGQLDRYLRKGEIVGACGAGPISAATRADYADAAAAVLTGDDHAGAIYELGGDEAFTMSELATTVAEATGHAISYRDLTLAQYTRRLVRSGIPKSVAALLADSDAGVARGDLFVTTGDLSRLIGHPATGYAQAVADAAEGLAA